MRLADDVHLTYCTNVHPAERWDDVLANLARHTVPLKARLAPDVPFGVGLRLSDLASRELLEGGRLTAFQAFLASHGLYVFTLNGFPFGAFHGERVKEAVFAPDWRGPQRAAYTTRLATILAALLPHGLDGGISTVPLAYRAWLAPGGADEATAAERLAEVVLTLTRLEAETGQAIHLDLEPEPGGALETTADVVAFFEGPLDGVGARWLAARTGWSREAAREALRRHVAVCFDACHQAVLFEPPGEALGRLASAGVRVGKVQASTALKVALPAGREAREAIAARLAPFAEGTYLHQVVARHADGLHAYRDLDDALLELHDPAAVEWRIHFHVPVFARSQGGLGTTRDELAETLAWVRGHRATRHVEIETYTWDVLPGRPGTLEDALVSEFAWVRETWSAPAPVREAGAV